MLETASIGRTVFVMFLVSLVAMSMFTGTAAAQADGEIDTQNFICNNEDTQFVGILEFLLGAFFIGSFAFGIISYAADKMDESLAGAQISLLSNFDGGKALKAGIGLPIGVWFITFVGNVMFGYDLSCIMPLQ